MAIYDGEANTAHQSTPLPIAHLCFSAHLANPSDLVRSYQSCACQLTDGGRFSGE